jgi:hypothetical protein
MSLWSVTHGFPASCRSSAVPMRLASRECSKEPPAIAYATPSTHSSLVRLISSSSRNCSNVTRGMNFSAAPIGLSQAYTLFRPEGRSHRVVADGVALEDPPLAARFPNAVVSDKSRPSRGEPPGSCRVKTREKLETGLTRDKNRFTRHDTREGCRIEGIGWTLGATRVGLLATSTRRVVA